MDAVLVQVVGIGIGGRVPRLSPTQRHVGCLEGRSLGPFPDQLVRVLHWLAVEDTLPRAHRGRDPGKHHHVDHPSSHFVLLPDA